MNSRLAACLDGERIAVMSFVFLISCSCPFPGHPSAADGIGRNVACAVGDFTSRPLLREMWFTDWHVCSHTCVLDNKWLVEKGHLTVIATTVYMYCIWCMAI